MPGFGYARISDAERKRLRKMVDEFLLKANYLKLLVIVLDARRDLGPEERNILEYCGKSGQAHLLVRTKWDTLNARERNGTLKKWEREKIGELCLPVSSQKRSGLEGVLEFIRNSLAPAPSNGRVPKS